MHRYTRSLTENFSNIFLFAIKILLSHDIEIDDDGFTAFLWLNTIDQIDGTIKQKVTDIKQIAKIQAIAKCK